MNVEILLIRKNGLKINNMLAVRQKSDAKNDLKNLSRNFQLKKFKSL